MSSSIEVVMAEIVRDVGAEKAQDYEVRIVADGTGTTIRVGPSVDHESLLEHPGY